MNFFEHCDLKINVFNSWLLSQKPIVDEYLEAYLEYLGKVAPDIAPQIDFLKKFHKFLLGIFHDIQRDKELWKLKIMVHGDSKVDNFMFKKVIDFK